MIEVMGLAMDRWNEVRRLVSVDVLLVEKDGDREETEDKKRKKGGLRDLWPADASGAEGVDGIANTRDCGR